MKRLKLHALSGVSIGVLHHASPHLQQAMKEHAKRNLKIAEDAMKRVSGK